MYFTEDLYDKNQCTTCYGQWNSCTHCNGFGLKGKEFIRGNTKSVYEIIEEFARSLDKRDLLNRNSSAKVVVCTPSDHQKK